MDGLSLVARARQAGLDVQAEGGTLLVKGPKRLADLAQALLAAKAEVLAELESEARLEAVLHAAVPICAASFGIRTVDDLLAAWGDGNPPARCYACGSARWWHLKPSGRLPRGGSWICARCHPPDIPPDEIERIEVTLG